jgi:Replication-relaxation
VIYLPDMPSVIRRPQSVVTDRDVAILRGLFESRVMGLAHISKLYFEGRDEAAKKRLQKLKAAGLIAERPRQLYETAILFLTRNGIRALGDAGALADYPQLPVSKLEKRMRVSPLTLRHEIDCMDVKAALTVAIASRPELTLTHFSTWPLLS